MRMVKDHTKTIKPYCPVNATKTPSSLIKGLYQDDITPQNKINKRNEYSKKNTD